MSSLLSVAMVGSSSVRICGVCEGVKLTRWSKLSLRKSQQGDAKLCSCTPSGSASSSAKVSEKLPKAHAKILKNVVVKPADPVYETISDDDVSTQGSSKILKKLLRSKGPARKRTAKFDLTKCAEMFENKPEMMPKEGFQIALVGNTSKFNTQTIIDTSTQTFANLLNEPNSKRLKGNSSPTCSQADLNLFLESFEYDDGIGKPLSQDKGAQQLIALCNEKAAAQKYTALVESLHLGASSGAEESRSSAAPPAPSNTTSQVNDGLPNASEVVEVIVDTPRTPVASQSFEVDADEIVVTTVSTISSATTTNKTNADEATSLTQQIGNEEVQAVKSLQGRLDDVKVAYNFIAGLQIQIRRIDEERKMKLDQCIALNDQIEGGRSRAFEKVDSLETTLTALAARKRECLEAIKAKRALIRSLLGLK
jgi:hypothetical protein